MINKCLLLLILIFSSGCIPKIKDNMARDLIIDGETLLKKAEIINNRGYYKKAYFKFAEAVKINNSPKAKSYMKLILKRMKR